MSITSKARRGASKRSATKARAKPPAKPPAKPIEPHAELRDQQGQLLAGIVRRDGEWVLGMGGQIAGSSIEAAQVFALIRRAARMHEAQGTPVRLTWSDALKDTVEAEVAARGLTFEQFEAELQSTMSANP